VGTADLGDNQLFVLGLKDGDQGKGVHFPLPFNAQKDMVIKKIPNRDLKTLVCQDHTEIRSLEGSDPSSEVPVLFSQFMFQHPSVEDFVLEVGPKRTLFPLCR